MTDPNPNDEGAAVPPATPQGQTAENERSMPCSEAACRAAIEAHDRRFRTLQAKAAIAGIQVNILSAPAGGSELVASRWAFAKRFDSVAALEAWLQRAGVQP